jgi:5-methylcytosine-specific restriction endonuclease McrA
MTNHKTCTKCKQIKHIDDFAKDARLKSGKPASCKQCKRDYQLVYRQNNLEAELARTRIWQQNNRPQTIINAKNWQINNKERVNELARLRYYKNPEKQRQAERKWMTQNPNAKVVANHVRRTKENLGKKFLVTNKELDKLRSGSCIACGSTKNIEIEHLVPVSRGGDYSVGNFTSLCKSCNSSKRDKTFYEWKIYRRKIGKPILNDGYNRSGGF